MSEPVILALSTSLGVAHVIALKLPQQWPGNWSKARELSVSVCFEFRIDDYRQQSLELLPRLKQAMVDSALTASDIAVIGVDIGPGGFTSLRTACGVAQGLAVAWAKPVVPVCSLHAMAVEAVMTAPVLPQGTWLSAIDARLNEVYAARILSQDDLHLSAPGLMAMEQWPDQARAQVQVVCDSALASLVNAPDAEAQSVVVVQSQRPALGVACMAWQALSIGQVHGPEACQPMYVRDKVAQTTQERMAGRHGHV